MDLDRRRLIKGLTAGAAGTALTATALAASGCSHLPAAAAATNDAPALVPFHGDHQAGVYTPPQRIGEFASFDLTAANPNELKELLQTITGRARFLASGGVTVDNGVAQPPSDSAVLGPDIPADGLTVTLALGASAFDDRYGLAARKPARLTAMKTFPNDALEPSLCHGDLMLQICGNNTDTVHHAIRDITKHTRGGMQLRWRYSGFQSPARPTGIQRNLMGFKDGISNPKGNEADKLVWLTGTSDEPTWTKGGTYQVVRLIRMLVEFWDRVSLAEQENMFGRRRDSGAPLDGAIETDVPNYAKDPKGETIPLDSHIRMANPRTAATDASRLLRRGYNYDRGLDLNGNLDSGLIFCGFQQDIARQFEATQTRLIDEPLVDYIQPFGGGYFFALPGVTTTNDWLGRTLLTA
jgi:deferrochelatase/peroxidase EfeB